MVMGPIIFSGSSNLSLANEVVAHLGTVLGKRKIEVFPDGEIYVEIIESVQEKDVLVLQSLGEAPNFKIMETLIMLDALKRASASSITLVLPYYAYARQDRINKSGTPITAKLLADILSQAGADHLITMDLHSESIEGFFNIPVNHLLSSDVLIRSLESTFNLDHAVVVAPDKGAIKIGGIYAKKLNLPLAFIDKERVDSFHVQTRLFVGDVKGKVVLLPDDMCATGGTLVSAANICMEYGAKRVVAVVAHGLFTDDALHKLENSSIERVIVTNSIPASERVSKHPKIKIVSIAPLLANAIRRATS